MRTEVWCLLTAILLGMCACYQRHVDKLNFVDGVPLMDLDTIGDVTGVLSRKQPVHVKQADPIIISGFAADRQAQKPASGVEVVIDGSAVYRTTYGSDRADVADYYKNPAYKKVGFVAQTHIRPGQHTVTVRVISADGRTYQELGPISIKID